MTPKERAAMQQALEALESCNVGNWSMAFDEFAVVEAITALREALAEQAEQEPVGRWNWNEAKFEWLTKFDYHKHHMTPLYAAPVRTKDLTDDEIEEALRNIDYFKTYSQIRIAAARAVIAADREKNK